MGYYQSSSYLGLSKGRHMFALNDLNIYYTAIALSFQYRLQYFFRNDMHTLYLFVKKILIKNQLQEVKDVSINSR